MSKVNLMIVKTNVGFQFFKYFDFFNGAFDDLENNRSIKNLEKAGKTLHFT